LPPQTAHLTVPHPPPPPCRPPVASSVSFFLFTLLFYLLFLFFFSRNPAILAAFLFFPRFLVFIQKGGFGLSNAAPSCSRSPPQQIPTLLISVGWPVCWGLSLHFYFNFFLFGFARLFSAPWSFFILFFFFFGPALFVAQFLFLWNSDLTFRLVLPLLFSLSYLDILPGRGPIPLPTVPFALTSIFLRLQYSFFSAPNPPICSPP